MIEILFRGKRKCDGLWVKGTGIIHQTDFYGEKVDRYFIVDGTTTEDNDIGVAYEVIPKAVGQYTGLQDKNGAKIFEGDIVKIAGFQVGTVVYECGSYGIVILTSIDWDYLDSEIAVITGCENRPYFCRNDNFISFWELMWNYNQEDDWCDVVEAIGNIYDNLELLEVD